jgi:protocatechuate 3,4-dioxygenase alpha subunit
MAEPGKNWLAGERDLLALPSQTIGPFFDFALTANAALGRMAGDGARGERIQLVVRVFDADGQPLPDAIIELWQADGCGKYDHPEDTQTVAPDPEFRGFGRLGTDRCGACRFETVRPGRAPGLKGELQAPHINVNVFARGVLWHLFTRIYFEGDPANENDAILELVPAERRDTLLARPDPTHAGIWNFDVRLSGERETVFFEA